MSWINIKNYLINLDQVASIVVRKITPDEEPLSLVFKIKGDLVTVVDFDTPEEAFDCLRQIGMFIRPAVIECQK